VTAEGPIQTTSDNTNVEKTFELSLSPFKRHTLWLPIETTGEGEIRFTAKAWDKTDGDGITHTLEVNKRYVLETAAQYGSTTKPPSTETILFPKEMRTDVGGVTVSVSPTVLGNLEGAFEVFERLPLYLLGTNTDQRGHGRPLQ
jgi:hypothetical protein